MDRNFCFDSPHLDHPLQPQRQICRTASSVDRHSIPSHIPGRGYQRHSAQKGRKDRHRTPQGVISRRRSHTAAGLWRKFPLARSESAEQILSLTPDQLREFHYSRLSSNDIHVFLSGNITPRIEALVTDTFSRIASGTSFGMSSLSFAPPAESPREVLVELPGSQQSAVNMMIPAPGRLDSSFVSLRCAVTALGGYFGSRLMLNIREARGLTYGISASLFGYPERSFISVATQTACDSVKDVRRLILEEIERMKDPASYTEDELMRLSRFLLSGLAATLDTPFSRMDFFKTKLYASTPDDYFEIQENFARRLDPANTSSKEAAELLVSTIADNFNVSRRITAVAGL
ncbi:insulinase family protein [Duncaniella sp. C9]|nr:insulinase family protein [Duncaniella sp. C9]